VQPCAAFCGIGNPRAFFDEATRRTFGRCVTKLSFRDHHKYSQSDIDRLTQEAKDKGARALITTAKDAVKLQAIRFELPCYVAEIDLEIRDAAKLLELVEEAIEAKRSSDY
jgi:tetraacyldisaccharide 4'-kinase